MRRAAALAMAGGAVLLAVAALWIWAGTKATLEPGPQTSQQGPQAAGITPQALPRDAAPEPETRSLRPEASSRPSADAGRRESATTLLATLRNSGSAHEPWEDQARTLLGALARDDIDATYAGCFAAGCAATLVFPTRATYERAASDPAAFPGWTGGRQWSEPELTEDGRITGVVVLFRPD